MHERYGRPMVEVRHPASHLDGPVDEHVGPYLPSAQGPVEGPAAGVFHHQAQVGLLKAHALKAAANMSLNGFNSQG